MESKKAQNLSITTIILIILGVVVLVVLIIGFTKGWGSVKEFFTGGGESDFQKVSSQCSIACATGDEISWCKNRTLEGVSGDCKWHAGTYTGIEGCSDITCPKDTTAKLCTKHKDFADLCLEGETCSDPIQGEFSDTAGGKVCCKVACTA